MNTQIPVESIRELDWNDYHKYIDKLADKIKSHQQSKKYKYVAGVDPDDMIVAVHLSHRLGIPVVTDINLLSLLINFADNSNSILIVSNVVATGNSFKQIMEETKCEFDTAVLFKDINSKFSPTYHVEIPSARIYFPWQPCGIDLKK
jgi:hypoxanthine phosphoribosyltransferase